MTDLWWQVLRPEQARSQHCVSVKPVKCCVFPPDCSIELQASMCVVISARVRDDVGAHCLVITGPHGLCRRQREGGTQTSTMIACSSHMPLAYVVVVGPVGRESNATREQAAGFVTTYLPAGLGPARSICLSQNPSEQKLQSQRDASSDAPTIASDPYPDRDIRGRSAEAHNTHVTLDVDHSDRSPTACNYVAWLAISAKARAVHAWAHTLLNRSRRCTLAQRWTSCECLHSGTHWTLYTWESTLHAINECFDQADLRKTHASSQMLPAAAAEGQSHTWACTLDFTPPCPMIKEK